MINNNTDITPENFDGTDPIQFVPDLPTIHVDSGIETFNNRILTTKKALIDHVLTMLGYPLITIELTPTQFDVCVSNACQLYTKYATFQERYMTIDLSDYTEDGGINLKKHNISQVKDITFASPMQLGMTTSELAFGMSGFVSQQASWRNFSFVSIQILHEYKELAERMLFPKPDWTYNNITGMLTMYPPPWHMLERFGGMYMVGSTNFYCGRFNSQHCSTCTDQSRCHGGYRCGCIPAIITVEIEPPLEELYSNDVIKTLTFGYAKILLGTIRSKFSNVTLPGGGTVDGETLRREGQEAIDGAVEMIRSTSSYGNQFFIA